ncbi:MAG: diadenylate cyclase CdaA [Clostridia bacterium]|nr:diadenylate cyclase CdaA [Clostridia bacterium]MBR2952957.1 diadenylate cyclase CdaA [Clostridia bacterium]
MLENFGTYFEQVKRAIVSFNSISDILDVLLVAFVIYSAIKLIRDTRAFQLVKGVVLLAAVYFMVSIFNMEASKYLLSLLFGNLLIILVIIFSPEIRHALESVGRSSVSNINLFNLKNRDESAIQESIKASINSVCKACSDLSDKQIGALIVFEKDTMLGEIAKTGTMLDATVTTELICNIFFPKAPMHDGAVIIKDGRVVSAGCILPLTGKNDLSSELGTRHRAAVGMTESSDALVVVVSEETGQISIAEKGQLNRDISDGDLREILSRSFIKVSDKESNKIKKILRGNKNESEE